VAELGVGPPPIPQRKLTVDSLARAIQVATNSQMQNCAADLGVKIRAEDGLGNAIAFIEENMT
jgi:sterol 3beta-glucosyltransferase